MRKEELKTELKKIINMLRKEGGCKNNNFPKLSMTPKQMEKNVATILCECDKDYRDGLLSKKELVDFLNTNNIKAVAEDRNFTGLPGLIERVIYLYY